MEIQVGDEYIVEQVSTCCVREKERIVRGRDCEHFVLGSSDYATVDWCDYWEAINLSSDGFCAWGERREA